MTASPAPSSGDFPAEWRPTSRHSTEKSPLGDVRVRGGATAEEVVAVLAALGPALGRTAAYDEPSRYELWRRGRLRALSSRAIRDTARAN